MKTYLSELFSNGNASKFFWTMLTASILGGVGWLSNLSFQVWDVKAKQEIAVVDSKNVKENVTEVKQDVKDIQKDVKEMMKLVSAISKKV